MQGQLTVGASGMNEDGWKNLIAKKRTTATFRITLTVRGKVIVKEIVGEEQFRQWKSAYQTQIRRRHSGVEKMSYEIIYK